MAWWNTTPMARQRPFGACKVGVVGGGGSESYFFLKLNQKSTVWKTRKERSFICIVHNLILLFCFCFEKNNLLDPTLEIIHVFFFSFSNLLDDVCLALLFQVANTLFFK